MGQLKNVTELLKQDKVQRLLYGTGLALWIYLWWDSTRFYYLENVVRIHNRWLMSIPAIILTGQVFFNRRLLWIATVAMVSAYSLFAIFSVIQFRIIDAHREYGHAWDWDTQEIASLTLMMLLLIFANWLVWKIKPVRRNKIRHLLETDC